jgi:hypothetical protein
MRMPLLALSLAMLLAGCGAREPLSPAAGKSLPPAPYGAEEKPTAAALLTPPPQARPQRSDELQQSSEQRRSDDFDLPPPND